MIGNDGVVAKRDNIVLRIAQEQDLPSVDEITIIC